MGQMSGHSRGIEETFGAKVRRLREERGITLRKFAEIIGASPTYVSKMEREQFPPPGEEKIKAIAATLGEDPDEMLALAGRVSSDLPQIIQRFPREMATFLRTAEGLSPAQIEELTRRLKRRKGEGSV